MTVASLLRTLLLCGLVAANGVPAEASQGLEPAAAAWSERGSAADAAEPLRLAQADCSAAAAQAAAQTGGQVLSVSSSNQGGQTVCVVTVLIPGQGGERPRRTTITLPG